MSNLLKEASILLTPTAYDNGRMLAVKPEIALGEELILNGDFSEGSANWSTTVTSPNIVQFQNDQVYLKRTVSVANELFQNSFTIGKTYKLQIQADIVSDGIAIEGNGDLIRTNLISGTNTFYLTPTSVVLRIICVNNTTEGSITNISVKEDLSGDFTFSRNSAATRVNAQGLVENVQILSSNLVSNGDFSQEGVQEVSNGSFSQEGSELVLNPNFNDSTWWGLDASWSILNGAANSNGSGTIYKGGVLTVGKNYKVVVSVSSYTSGTLSYPNASNTIPSEVGVYTFYYTANSQTVSFTGSSFIGSIDNVSVKEVGQDWTLDSGWSIGDNKSTFNSSSGAGNVSQINVFESGKTYRITFDTLETNGGNLAYRIGAGGFVFINAIAANTKHTITETATSVGSLSLRGATNFNGSITNISVKEVGQDWEFTDGTTITDNGVRIFSDGTLQRITQNNILTVGKQYKIQYEILENNSGELKMSSSFGLTPIPSTVGTHAVYAEALQTFLSILRVSACDITITNISIIEITDDTNLPRINYEGFSYQDSLGSEEIVNGDFATDTNWAKGTGWTVSGGAANCDGTQTAGTQLTQNGTYTVNKIYKITYTATVAAGNVDVRLQGVGATATGATRTTSGTYTDYLTSTGNTSFRIRGNTDFIGSIDNVSIKEYLGQEVVPNSGCGSWLMEGQSTNLALNSETFLGYGKSNVNISGSSIISPDGTSTAIKLALDNGTLNSNGGLSFSYSSTAGEALSWSMFVKKAEYRYLTFSFGSSSAVGFHFDLDTGLITQNLVNSNYTLIENKIESFNNGWYRLSVSLIELTGASTRFVCVKPSPILPTAGNNNYSSTGDGTSGIYVWGAQLEQKSYPTSYIPTQGAASTRLQDIATNSGNASLINSEEGVLYAEISTFNNSSTLYKCISVSDGTTSNRAFMRYNVGTNDIFFAYVSNGVTIATFNSVGFVNISDFNKLAFSWKLNQFKAYINGVQISTTITSGSVSSGFSELNFNDGSINPFYGKNKALAVYKTALTDASLRCLTYPPAVATTFDLDFNTIADDFTFTRGSEATFVNAQGLIQSTNELGSELVTNGDFDDGSTGWSKGSGWSIADGKASCDGNQTSQTTLQSVYNLALGIGNLFKITFDISNYSSGQISVITLVGTGGPEITNINANGSYTAYSFGASTSDGKIQIIANSGFIGSIDNISVKENITATNTPRLDYSTGSEAFLLEPQSTNRITQSELFSDASWTANTDVIIDKGYVAPDGTNNATKVSENGGNPKVALFLSVNTPSTKSIYARTVSGTGAVYLGEGSINGVLSNVTEQWQRFEISNNLDNFYGVDFRGASTLTEVIIWGAQVEQQSYATSYIPTSGASATRNQELCNNATPVINSEEGTLYVDINALANDGTYREISLNDGTTNNVVEIRYTNITNQLQFVVRNGGSVVVSRKITLTSALDFNKIAFSYKSNNYKMYVNGIEVGNDTSGLTPSGLNALSFDWGASNPFFGNTKGLKYYPKALADVQLQDLTSWGSFAEMANALNYTIK